MYQEYLRLKWTGKLVTFNKYLKARALKTRTGKYIGMMYSSSEYKALVNSLITSLKQIWNKEPITEHVDMILKTSRWKIADTGNVEKPISDSLQNAGVIKNDNLIRNIFILRSYHPKGEDDLLEIILYPVYDREVLTQIITQELLWKHLTKILKRTIFK